MNDNVTRGPRRFTEAEFEKVGVKLINPDSLCFECQSCGAKWHPMLKKGGKIPRGYWRCPEGCNEPER